MMAASARAMPSPTKALLPCWQPSSARVRTRARTIIIIIEPRRDHQAESLTSWEPVMFNAIIGFALRYRSLVVALSLVCLVYGGYLTTQMPIDVFPDLD